MTASKPSKDQLISGMAKNNLIAYTIYTLRSYQAGRHHRELSNALMAVERGEIKRLMVTMPPRHGKSELGSRRFPAWYLGKNPTKEIIFATYGQELANDFGTSVRNQVDDPAFRDIFGTGLKTDTKAKKKFLMEVPKGEDQGGYTAVGVGGAITGRGMHVGIIDDPIKNRQEAQSPVVREAVWSWYQSTFYTRLAPGGAIILIQTRWHEDDLAGKILEEINPDDKEPWTIINMPAIDEAGDALWPERFDIDALNQIKEDIGLFEFEALYQQNPTPKEGALIKHAWINTYRELPEVKQWTWSWDTAIKDGDNNDYSVGGLWAECDNGFYLVDVWRNKVQYPDLKKAVKFCFDSQRSHEVIIEDKASGQQLVQDFRRLGNMPCIGVSPGKDMPNDKVSRVNLMAPYFEAGKVFVKEGAPWVKDYIHELTTFPNGKHDDCVDMSSQFFARVNNRKAPKIRSL